MHVSADPDGDGRRFLSGNRGATATGAQANTSRGGITDDAA